MEPDLTALTSRFLRRCRTICKAGFALLLFGLFIIPVGSAQPDYRPGYLYVEFADQAMQPVAGKTGLAVFDEVAERYGVQSIEKAFPFLDAIATHRTLTPQTASLRNVYKVFYTSPYAPGIVADELARDAAVVLAEPQPLYRVDTELPAVPNDPEYAFQLHLSHLNLPAAWDVVKGSQGNVLIAIVDTGVQFEHEDLVANLWVNPNEIPNNQIDDDYNGFVDDTHGWNFRADSPDAFGDGTLIEHGTMVTGAANAVTDNSIGIAGAAWNARFVPINTGCERRERLCYTDQGVLYAAMLGADIINCSFGSVGESKVSRRVYEAAFAEGSLSVAASGNGGIILDWNPRYPASYAVNLSVGGTSQRHDNNNFNYGKSVNVFAPSRSIDVTAPSTRYTEPRLRYAEGDGTSFAAPLVSGVAALVKTAFPHFSPGEIREQIRMTAESIDEANSGYEGLFGRGRVNALRAATEEVPWALRLTNYSYWNQDGSDKVATGDEITVRATYRNFLGNAENLEISLRSPETFVRVTSDPVANINLPKGDSVTVEFTFELYPWARDNRTIVLYAEISDGTITDVPDVFRVNINQNKTALHQTAALRVSVTDEGNIGYTKFQHDASGQGIGFRPLDRNGTERDPLFEGGLIVAQDYSYVSSSIRGDGGIQQRDFRPEDGEALAISEPGDLTSQYGRILLTDDSDCCANVGVHILQESFTDNTPVNEDFIILKYSISDRHARWNVDLHVGFFLDWDVTQVDSGSDIAQYSSVERTGWVTDDSGSLFVGTLLLTDKDKLNYRAISNTAEFHYGYSDREKWAHLSGGITQVALGPEDVSQITSVGPLRMRRNETIEVAFAVIAGTSEADYLANARSAQALWDNVINAPRTAMESSDIPARPELRAVYPNPASGPVTIEYSAPAGSEVELDVFDILGRKTKTVFSGHSTAGLHRIQWDPRSSAGSPLSRGVYLLRLQVEEEGQLHRQTMPVVLLR